MVEEFDLWLEGREAATIEKPAPKKQKQVIHVKKYKTIPELLGFETEADSFAQGADEEALADLVASGEIASSELSAHLSKLQP